MAKNTMVITINIDKIEPFVAHSEVSQAPLMLTGPSGIGKSEFVESIASKGGRLCSTKILAALGTEDIALAGPRPGDNFISFLMNNGFPFVGTEDRWLHPKTGKAPFLFLDEISNVMPYMRNAVLQMFSERSMHGIPFIPGTVLIAAGNRASDAADVSKMSGPLANRLVHLNVDPPTVEGFKSYCVSKGVNEFIPAYIDQNPTHLHRFNADEFASGLLAFPTPRAWVRFVAPILDNPTLDDFQRMTLIAGSVGPGVAQDFETFYRLRLELPNMDTILNTGKGNIPKNVSTKFLVVAALVRRATNQNLGNVLNYVATLASTDPEWADLFEKNLLTRNPTFALQPAYTKWALHMNRKPITNVLSQPTPDTSVAPPTTPTPTPTPAPTPAPIPAKRRI